MQRLNVAKVAIGTKDAGTSGHAEELRAPGDLQDENMGV